MRDNYDKIILFISHELILRFILACKVSFAFTYKQLKDLIYSLSEISNTSPYVEISQLVRRIIYFKGDRITTQ